MQPEPFAKVEYSLNRLELINQWGKPLDPDWARAKLEEWLRGRVDLTQATVYDSGVLAKGDHHG